MSETEQDTAVAGDVVDGEAVVVVTDRGPMLAAGTIEQITSIGDWSEEWLRGHLPGGLDGTWMVLLIHLGAIAVACLLTFLIARRVVIPLIAQVIKRSAFLWDDVFLHADVFRRVSNLAAAFVAYLGAAGLLGPWPVLQLLIGRLALATMVVFALLAFMSLLNAANALYEGRKNARNRPIKGYLSLVKIIASVVVAILVVGILIDQSPVLLLTGLGAMTAVLLLIFKDTILSVVAAVTIGSSDMVRVGDWISMPSAGADGDVIDIALHHVKVQNWDKTIVTIPTYRLVSDSFTNWRGMKQSGGRRIKRSINLDLSSVGFLDDEQMERFERFVLLRDYMREKREILERYNAEHETSDLTANARRLTNIGTLRAYLVNYLRGLDTVHQEGKTFLVRQLQPTEHGLGMEIYVFAKTTDWAPFEAIQADIFDHVLAIIPEFGLRVFQSPSGADVERGLARIGARD